MLTGIYAGILGLIYTGLTAYVIQGRWKYKVGIGTGQNHDLSQRIRVHGNFAEYAPMGLLLLMICELSNAPASLIHMAGTMLVAGRVLHLYGFGKSVKASPGRFLGTNLTMGSIIISSLGAITLYLRNGP